MVKKRPTLQQRPGIILLENSGRTLFWCVENWVLVIPESCVEASANIRQSSCGSHQQGRVVLGLDTQK